eukprot:NODE_1405_length_1172_cov_179.461264_g1150_i0.p1 GENE.NODE_1405_length_1172_cov_179.461264_g1150_i0~~NODE_1405_length_1172_cov_179.461264_g1150_i0.p1  ORF type:complete len:240 (+),score=48.20 NODE_1405_length_1172_cov_179.461264_g1150_i0:55-720(+)
MQQYNQQSFRAEHPEDYASRSAKAIPATVRMFSGCMDSQTSADVSNVSSFGLPEGTGPGGAGGACTNAMMLALANNPSPTYIELLGDMRAILSEKGYTQKPELSASHEMDLNTPFVLTPGSRSKSLLVGINYKGMQGELRGCVNDVLTMQQLLLSQGFEGGDQMRIHPNSISRVRVSWPTTPTSRPFCPTRAIFWNRSIGWSRELRRATVFSFTTRAMVGS